MLPLLLDNNILHDRPAQIRTNVPGISKQNTRLIGKYIYFINNILPDSVQPVLIKKKQYLNMI